MYSWSFALACLVGMVAVGAAKPPARPFARQISFARGKWNPADFIPVKSWRNTYVGSFDHRMAPLLAFAPALEANAAGQLEFREHWEVVLYDRGLNVWHHYFEDGRQKWFKCAAMELPKGMEFRKDKVYDLVVKTRVNARGRKEMVVACGGYRLIYVDDSLPTEFYAGIVGCEGRNFFYDLRVE